MTALPAFTFEQKQLRRAAIAELEAIEDRRDEWANRPFGTYTPTAERAVEDRFTRRTKLAEHALTSTARCYLDEPAVCFWRARVREQIRMTRLYQNDKDEERREKMAGYYRERVGRWVQGYRRAIAHARPATSLQAAE